MRRWLAGVSIAFLVLDFALLGTLFYYEQTNLNLLTTAREELFSEWVTDPARLEPATPNELVAHGFLTDSDETIEEWRARIEEIPVYRDMLAKLPDAPSTLDKAKQISLSFSRNGGKAYGQLADLEEKLKTISSPPQGYCNDHTEVFLALASVADIDASELIIGGHVTCDVYCPELKDWVWIDPEFALLAKGPDGEYLSGFELWDAYRNDTPFQFEFFGLPEHEFSHSSPRDHVLYDRDLIVSEFGVVWGNNVFTTDYVRSQLLFLPKAVRQVPMLMLGIQPEYRIFSDEESSYPSVLWREIIIVSFVLILAIGTLVYPAYVVYSFARRRLRGEQPSPASEPQVETPTTA